MLAFAAAVTASASSARLGGVEHSDEGSCSIGDLFVFPVLGQEGIALDFDALGLDDEDFITSDFDEEDVAVSTSTKSNNNTKVHSTCPCGLELYHSGVCATEDVFVFGFKRFSDGTNQCRMYALPQEFSPASRFPLLEELPCPPAAPPAAGMVTPFVWDSINARYDFAEPVPTPLGRIPAFGFDFDLRPTGTPSTSGWRKRRSSSQALTSPSSSPATSLRSSTSSRGLRSPFKWLADILRNSADVDGEEVVGLGIEVDGQ